MPEFSFEDLRPDVPLLDYMTATEFYVDGIATIEWLGANVRMTYFTWGTEPGSNVIKRIPVAKIVRPVTSIIPGLWREAPRLGMWPVAVN